MRPRKRQRHWHPKPYPLPYLYGSFFPDQPQSWLDEPWNHVLLIVAMLIAAGILIFVFGGPA